MKVTGPGALLSKGFATAPGNTGVGRAVDSMLRDRHHVPLAQGLGEGTGLDEQWLIQWQ